MTSSASSHIFPCRFMSPLPTFLLTMFIAHAQMAFQSVVEYPKTADDILWTPSWKSGGRDEKYGDLGQYCEDLSKVIRRKTRTVECGPVKFGSEHPIVRQTMATTDTSDVKGTMEQVMRCADKGFDLVRITVQGKREANAAAQIREGAFFLLSH
mmetsp:Transcript_18289/g.41775  ORF Transcript_18289/g.41775 Transcript_18289/m.41775 type:complete len:154 (-) Transcript_18289:1966-2427(-)